MNKFFDAVFYINLDSREDRKTMILQEFDKLGVQSQRVKGMVFDGQYDGLTESQEIKKANGIMGCMLSHLSILHWACKHNASVMIFEDDAKFINNYQEIIPNALAELPYNWDMIYLGGNICNTITPVSPFLGKLSHSQSTHAYGVNKKFVGKLIDYINTSEVIPLDLTYAYKVIPNNNCYITIPMVAVQQPSFSDIEGVNVEYESWMEDRFYKNLKRIEDVRIK
jgi:GR25 family glycosyltransferase involved in LPS biosynthesis